MKKLVLVALLVASSSFAEQGTPAVPTPTPEATVSTVKSVLGLVTTHKGKTAGIVATLVGAAAALYYGADYIKNIQKPTTTKK